MGKLYDAIDGRLREFVLGQPVFFVATAATEGRVNVSPKGMKGTFTVLGPNRVAYLDHTGSGVETIAHLRDNGRITLMFCAFSGPPNVVRLHGRGEAVLPEDPRFAELYGEFHEACRNGICRQSGVDAGHGLRSVIVVDVERVSDSCGFAVPLLDYVGERTLLDDWAARRTDEDLVAYRKERNAASIDGLPALG